MDTITIKYDGKQKTVDLDQCVKVMTVMLRDFGYDDLSQETVKQQISAIQSGGQLTVIGHILKDYIVI